MVFPNVMKTNKLCTAQSLLLLLYLLKCLINHLQTFVFKTEKREKRTLDENLATCAQNKFRFAMVVGQFPTFSKHCMCLLVILKHQIEEGHTNTQAFARARSHISVICSSGFRK
jgi:hypothetical protein